MVRTPGSLTAIGSDGCLDYDAIPTAARRTSMRLIAQEVIPALRDYGKQLGLTDPFEVQPGSRKLPATGKPEPVAHAEALTA